MTSFGGRQRPRLIAHRGHSIGAPENTMAAYEAAVRLGADMIESDVQLTRDGVLVMLHDATLDRTSDASGRLADRTRAELEAVDAGSWFGAAFRGERVPLLEELFDLADRAGIGLCLESKGERHEDAVSIATATATAIQRRGRLAVDVLASFDHAALRVASEVVPGLRVAPDRLPERGASSADELLAQARAVDAVVIQHDHRDLDAGTVATVQAAGVELWVWSVTEPEDIARCQAMGVAGLMGDDVGALVAVVSGE